MVSQAGQGGMMINVLAHHGFGVFVPLGLILVAVGILGIGLKMQEVSADGP